MRRADIERLAATLVTDINQATPFGSDPAYFRAAGGYVYFLTLSANSYVLWRTDGTAAGNLTHIVVGGPYVPGNTAGTSIQRMLQIAGRPLATARSYSSRAISHLGR
mgnify:CR=1 FL=1